MKNKVYAITNGVMLLLTIMVNYLSNTGIFDGNTMKTVSDEYFTRFTPAGYAFSIWGVIYLGLACFVVYSATNVFKGKDPLQAVERIGGWFMVSCLCNMLWVVAWLNHFTLLSAMIMTVLLISLCSIVVKLRLSLTKIGLKNYLFIALPFSLYAGWVSLAIIANIASLLVKFEWSRLGLTEVTWAVIMIAVAGTLNLLMILTRNMRAYGAVGIWGILAVAAAQHEGNDSITYTCYAVAVLILLTIAFNYFKPTFGSGKEGQTFNN